MNAIAFLNNLNDALQAPRHADDESCHVLRYYGGTFVTASLSMRIDEAKAVYASEAPWFPIDEGYRSHDGRTLIVVSGVRKTHEQMAAEYADPTP